MSTEWSQLKFPEKDNAWVIGGKWGLEANVIEVKCTLPINKTNGRIRVDVTYSTQVPVIKNTGYLCLNEYEQFSGHLVEISLSRGRCSDLERHKKYIEKLLRKGYSGNEGKYYKETLRSIKKLERKLCE